MAFRAVLRDDFFTGDFLPDDFFADFFFAADFFADDFFADDFFADFFAADFFAPELFVTDFRGALPPDVRAAGLDWPIIPVSGSLIQPLSP